MDDEPVLPQVWFVVDQAVGAVEAVGMAVADPLGFAAHNFAAVDGHECISESHDQ